jgi:peptidoglycan/xylan/chitin deacetylase (PgdA/CDA1 family)
MRRYSDLSHDELTTEIETLHDSIQRATMDSQRDVLIQKWLLARSYLVKERDFPAGNYRVEGYESIFKLSYLNGVMAWGIWEHGEQTALPIALLQKLEELH